MNRFTWLVKRELWESRAIWIAPLVCYVIVVGGALISSGLGHSFQFGIDDPKFATTWMGISPAKVDSFVSVALSGVAAPFFIMLVFTQFFYSIDALYGERRERSILFWKSLPVSDAETVLSKLFIAAVVMPAVVTVAAFAAQVSMGLLGTLKLGGIPGLVPHLWNPAVWVDVITLDLYVLVTGMLWALPVIAFNLLLSAAVPKAPFGYAILGPAAVMFAELIVFRTGHVFRFVVDRYFGLFSHVLRDHAYSGYSLSVSQNQADAPHSLLAGVDPVGFLSSPAVLGGLLVGAALLAGAVWVRRYRDASY